jgi:hypothetical protein
MMVPNENILVNISANASAGYFQGLAKTNSRAREKRSPTRPSQSTTRPIPTTRSQARRWVPRRRRRNPLHGRCWRSASPGSASWGAARRRATSFCRLIIRVSHLRLPASAIAEKVAHVRVCPDHVQLGDRVLCQPSSSAVKTILIEEPN